MLMYIFLMVSLKDVFQFMGGKVGNFYYFSFNQILVFSWFCVSLEMCWYYLSVVSDDIVSILSNVDYSNQD